MKTRTFLISVLAVIGLACGIADQAAAQGGGGGFTGRIGRSSALTREQMTKIDETMPVDIAELNTKLADAQRAAIKAATAKFGNEADCKAKIEAVTKIQIEIAMLRYKGVRLISSSLTDDQRQGMNDSPAPAYQLLFSGGSGVDSLAGGTGGGGFGGGTGGGGFGDGTGGSGFGGGGRGGGGRGGGGRGGGGGFGGGGFGNPNGN
jgi:Spy/CpxP family protein refolding chaperone